MPVLIPRDAPDVTFAPAAGHSVRLTNLDKVFFPDGGFTKGDLLQYYADVAPLLVPYLTGRAMADQAAIRTASTGTSFT